MTDIPPMAEGRAMVDVAALDDLQPGKLKLVRAGHARVAIVRVGDEVRAVSAICTHARIFLAPGRLGEDGLIECPSHGAKFSPLDGGVRCSPATTPLQIFRTAIVDGRVHVDPGEPPADAPQSTTTPGARASAAQWGSWS
jgi:nitrite reductase/ring-hydroxylating ferredoxin subunit